MANVPVMKGSFTSGELSPRMLARADVDRYKNGAIQLENFLVLLQGGVTRRPGTRFVALAKYANRLCVVRAFEPSTTDAYILEVGHQYARFYRNAARIENPPGTPVEVVTPYLDSDLRLLRSAQSNDVMIFVHPSHAPRRLSRLSDTSWVLSLLTFDPPPLYEAGASPAIGLTLSAVSGSAITVTAASSYWLQGDVQRGLTSGVGRAVITGYTSPTVVTATVLDAFSSTSLLAGTWTLQGSPVASLETTVAGPAGALTTLSLTGGGTNLVTDETLDTPADWTDISTGACSAEVMGGQGVLTCPAATLGTGDFGGLETIVTPLVIGQVYTLEFDNIAVGNNRQTIGVQIGTASGLTDVAAIAYQNVAYNIQIQFTATAATVYVGFVSSFGAGNVAGVDGAAAFDNVAIFPTRLDGFRVEDVGKYIRAGDAYVQLVTWLSAQEMTGRIVQVFPSRDPTTAGAWTLESPAWSDILGWPSEVVLYEGRLFFWASPRFPKTTWGSGVDDFTNFAIGPQPADPLAFSLVNSGGNITLDAIVWVMPAENLLYGTTHGVYRLVGAGDDPLTPTNLPRNRNQDAPGSASIRPVKAGGSLIYAERQGAAVFEVLLSQNGTSTFIARDITVTSDHFFARNPVVEFAYQPGRESLVWVLRDDGALVPCTYNLREEIRAWWQCTTAGAFQSVAVIPHPTAPAYQTWVSVTRNTGGVGFQAIEYFDPQARMVLPEAVTMFNELTQESEEIDGWDGLTVDSAVVLAGINTATLTGLTHLEGTLVTIVGDGAVFPAQVVVGGQVTLPQVVHTAFVGVRYEVRGRTLPVEVAQAPRSTQGARKRWAQLSARVQNTASLILQNERIPFRKPHMPQNQGVAPFSGDRTPTPIGYDTYGMVSFSVPEPLPCTLIAVYGTVDLETS